MSFQRKWVYLASGLAAVSLAGSAALLRAQAGGNGSSLNPLPTFASNGGGASWGDGGVVPAGLQNVKQVGQMDDDGKVAALTATLFSSQHYARHPMDDKISSEFLDRFLDTLDPQHLFFLASDIQEFEKYRNSLDELTLSGDVSPAYIITDRFKQRLRQQLDFMNASLKTEKFSFDGSDSINVDRKKAAYPANETEQKALWLQNLRFQYLQEKLANTKPEKITSDLTRRFTRTERYWFKEFDKDNTLELYLNALALTYDPHSSYFGKATNDNFAMQISLSLFGIGATLQSEDGYTKIVELVPGGPAAKSGKLSPGDRIVGVKQGDKGEMMDMIDVKVDKVVEQIRGPKGTPVTLTIIPADALDTSVRKTVTLIRDQVKLEEQAAKAKLIEIPGNGGASRASRIGVIELPSFYADPERGRSATQDVKILLQKMLKEGAAGIILDLRFNGGGSLTEAITMSGLFLKGGPVVQVKDARGAINMDGDDDPVAVYGGPLIVLTNHVSASASEILTGALQDYGRAVIVGDTSTFGKGTVQTIIPLKSIFERAKMSIKQDPGAIKVTIQKFYRPSGKSVQLQGVIPEITLPSLSEALPYAEKREDNPLPYDTIPSAQFTPDNKTKAFIPELKRLSDSRVSKSVDFSYLKTSLAQALKLRDEKTISLNEASRRQEKMQAEARRKARQQQLAARPADTERIFRLTLADAGKPGLPLPVTAKQLADASLKSAVARAKLTADDADDEALNARVAEPDTVLSETERIMTDYITLTKK